MPAFYPKRGPKGDTGATGAAGAAGADGVAAATTPLIYNAGTRTISVVVGATSGSVAAGNDARLSDARTPTSHAASHATGGTDAITPSAIGAAAATHTHAQSEVTGLTGALAGKQDASAKGQPNGYAGLDGSGRLDSSTIPPLAISSVSVVSTTAQMIALTGMAIGDVVVVTTDSTTYIHNGGTAGTIADWTMLLTPPDLVSSVAGRTGAIVLTVADVSGAVSTSDSRLTDSRTPSAHAASHAAGQPDAITPAAIGAAGTSLANVFTHASGQTISGGGGLRLTTASGVTTQLLFAGLASDAFYRFIIDASGKLAWGDGTAASDVSLYRPSSGRLYTDGSLEVNGNSGGAGVMIRNGNGLWLRSSSPTGTAAFVGVAGDAASARMTIDHTGRHQWGDGTVSPADTSLARSAAGVLQTLGTMNAARVTVTAISAPATLTATPSTTGGTLAAATYFYAVTSLDARGIESTPVFASATTTGATSSIGLTWATVTGTTGYRVYRNSTTNAATFGASSFLTSITAGTTTYTDTNAVALTTGTPAQGAVSIQNGGIYISGSNPQKLVDGSSVPSAITIDVSAQSGSTKQSGIYFDGSGNLPRPMLTGSSDSVGRLDMSIGVTSATSVSRQTNLMAGTYGYVALYAALHLPYRTQATTTAYALESKDHTFDARHTSGTLPVTLPPAGYVSQPGTAAASGALSSGSPIGSGVPAGRVYVIKNSSTGITTITGQSGQLIDGQATITMSQQYQSVTLQSTGTGWIIL